ncbi:MAG: hypothetical protein Q7S87_10010 [Agitococcus sp.]|nr:hypothetical protein [Agitococcus sp.]MDO9179334.1 hypothetical protein [Agitococcus sp.]
MIAKTQVRQTWPTSNVRHDIEPALVQEQIAKKVAMHEQNRILFKNHQQDLVLAYEQAKIEGTAAKWAKLPEGPGYVDTMIDHWIDVERTRYALVRVIELPKKGKRFILVYGEEIDSMVTSGTGPFDSFYLASEWFLHSGR